jgi:hypothetical protein
MIRADCRGALLSLVYRLVRCLFGLAGAEYSSVQVKDIVDGLGFWWVSRALRMMAA